MKKIRIIFSMLLALFFLSSATAVSAEEVKLATISEERKKAIVDFIDSFTSTYPRYCDVRSESTDTRLLRCTNYVVYYRKDGNIGIWMLPDTDKFYLDSDGRFQTTFSEFTGGTIKTHCSYSFDFCFNTSTNEVMLASDQITQYGYGMVIAKDVSGPTALSSDMADSLIAYNCDITDEEGKVVFPLAPLAPSWMLSVGAMTSQIVPTLPVGIVVPMIVLVSCLLLPVFLRKSVESLLPSSRG